jgi:(p)ppGpp synthase/HD superfamily hydrolase
MEGLYSLQTDALRERLLSGAGNGWPSLEAAIDFATQEHEGQLRKGVKEPFVNHLLRTGLLLSELAGQRDANILCAGVLHDVLEDTPAELDAVEDGFGSRVADLVRALTHPDQREGESRHARNLRWFESLRWEGRDVHIVKSADRLDNILTMEGAFDAERRITYLSETRDALLPLTLSANTALYHALDRALAAEEAR